MLSRCTEAEPACLDDFCLQIMRAAAFERNGMFYILGCWFGLLTFSVAFGLPIPSPVERGQP